MTTQPCLICGRQTGHPDHLCSLCLPWVEYVRGAQPFTAHEKAALDRAIEHVAPLVDANGPDLSAWDDAQVREFAGEIVRGFGAGLREEIGKWECPF